MTGNTDMRRGMPLERIGRYVVKILPDHTMTFSETENGAWMRAPEVLPALERMRSALEEIKEAYDGCDGCIGGQCSWCIANQALEDLSHAMGAGLRRPGHAAACSAPFGPLGSPGCHCLQNHDSHG